MADLRVLVVDDDPFMRAVLVMVLAEIGIAHIDIAVNGEDALEKLTASSYGLVFSAWNMNSLDGIDLVKRVRADATLCTIRFIMISGNATPESVAIAENAGVDAYLVKPVDIETLAATIDMVR